MSGLTPLVLFLLACAMAYVGATQVAFSALMRLPLRLSAERGERPERVGTLGYYLDDPLRLFMPARIVQALAVALLTAVVGVEFGPPTAASIGPIIGGIGLSVIVFGHVVPLLVVRRDPEARAGALAPVVSSGDTTPVPLDGPASGLAERRRSRSVRRVASGNGGVRAER